MASRMNQMKRTATKEVNKQARLQTGSITRADNDVGYLMILGGLIGEDFLPGLHSSEY